ncbi:hypothetical protein KDL29_11660 [bacterium]|nr:hypothetical protein [bacterium]MCB1220797.1 hypothetical protein [bacterium]UNM09445.1 MAG: hypothetical protein H7A35_05155 [Planctomycetales bacterium]
MSAKLMVIVGIIGLNLLLCIAMVIYQYASGVRIRRGDISSPIHNGFYLLVAVSVVIIALVEYGFPD